MHFSALLRHHRTAMGVSQKTLARVTGLDRSYISRLESGDRDPSREVIEQLADALTLNSAQRVVLAASAGYLRVPVPEPLLNLVAALSLSMGETERVTVLRLVSDCTEDIIDTLMPDPA